MTIYHYYWSPQSSLMSQAPCPRDHGTVIVKDCHSIALILLFDTENDKRNINKKMINISNILEFDTC